MASRPADELIPTVFAEEPQQIITGDYLLELVRLVAEGRKRQDPNLSIGLSIEMTGRLVDEVIGWRKRWMEKFGARRPRHAKQSRNGCVTCSRKWSEHTPYEIEEGWGATPEAGHIVRDPSRMPKS